MDGYCQPGADAASGNDASVDAAPWIDADTTDAAPRAGFGEPCDDKSDCESNICILVGISGICTDLCVADSCPDEYGCYGVLGVIEPNQVADVCVPESTQICTQCAAHGECAIVGQDLCLEYDNGKQFCARDCSAVECPMGYTCQDVVVDTATYKQCIPNSGACDCNAALTDTTEPCSLTTPFGTCAGTRTCMGASGWGACSPPSSTDVPDATFTDDNCDGIDGTMTAGIFVSRDVGVDDTDCGQTYTDPCWTINRGILEAAVTGRNYIYVQASAGDYNEVVVMLSGKHIYGGYDAGWQRGPSSDPAHRVRIVGGLDSAAGGDNEYLTIRAHNLVVATRIGDVIIVGPAASGVVGSSGRGSYAVHVESANLTLERTPIVGGNGASGGNGGNGTAAPTVDFTVGMRGGTGGGADEFVTECNNTSRGGGGGAGTNSCGGGLDPNGGGGGGGGTMDTSCSGFPWDWNLNNTSGLVGGNAAQWATSAYGYRGGGGSPCAEGGAGNAGRVQNGGPGSGGTGGFLSTGYWYANGGGPGGLGQNGGGGGGGGGSGGCDTGTDSYGAGGGGGGAGGCAAASGGGGGQGGGGSFGVLAVAGSTVTITGCNITRGAGGAGGAGGQGGRGQSGGPGGLGGPASGDSAKGGDGNKGGHGGHSGGGGGGAGGLSAGIASNGSTVNHDCGAGDITGGSGGGAGSAGAAASAPVGDNDGNPGNAGGAGGLATTTSL